MVISMQHHYGVIQERTSTPIWSMGARHQTGANRLMAVGNNIEALREARGWKRPRLAALMGTTPQQVERLEKGQRKLSLEWIEKAATALEVDPSQIIAADPDVRVAPLTQPYPDGSQSIALRQVDLGFSMGDGANIDDYVEEGTLDFDANLLRTITRSPPERLFVARGAGDSMMPTLLNDDMVVIDTLQRQLNMLDRIWAVSVHGAGAIKRLRATGKQRVMVISDNPTVENQEVNAEDLRILGRVIWVGRRV